MLVTTPNCTQSFEPAPVEFSHMLDVDHRQQFTVSSLEELLAGTFGSAVVEQAAPVDGQLAGLVAPRVAAPARARPLPRRDRPAALLLAPAGRAPGVTRVLVVSPEPVGERMAGPAIRALELARALAERCEVTLSAPAPSVIADERVSLLTAGLEDFDRLLAAIAEHDVVVAQTPARPAPASPGAAGDAIRRRPLQPARRRGARGARPRRPARAGDGAPDRALGAGAVRRRRPVICASEKQRDLWLGGMAMAGLLDVDAYREDPTYRAYVEVVPFGIPEHPPARAGAGLRERWPAIGEDDRVLIWAGGIWRWLDPVTPIRAMPALNAGGARTHLVFMGTGRPALDPSTTPYRGGAGIEAARERGLEGETVHFNQGWIPYAERGAVLLEADLGISAHHDHLEARFSFRTRALDYLWAGLPVVCTGGDSVGEMVEREGLGRAVAPGDHAGFAAACAELLEPEQLERARGRIEEAAPALRWSQAAAPLIEYCADPGARPRPGRRRGVAALATWGQYPYIAGDLGLREAVRRGARIVSRALRRGR